MIKSMTGYGRAKYEVEGREYQIEIKAVNHKYSDVSIKLPRSISYLEEKIKKEVTNRISRGKIDIFITFLNTSNKGKNIKINKELAKLYIEELNNLADEANIKKEYSIIEIAKFPEVLLIENDEDEDLIWKEIQIPLVEALNSLVQMKETEGEKLKIDLQNRIERITEKIEEISKLSTGLVEEYVVKLEERIKEILKTDVVDQTRLAQEIVIYSDKCSVEEELTRLKSHISQFLSLIEGESPIGKKLDFLIQEMNRETNTIGSKANKLEITNRVVDMKTEIENIREQIQNIE